MNGRDEYELNLQLKINESIEDAPYYVKEWYTYLIASGTTTSTCSDYIRKIFNFLSYINRDVCSVKLNDISKNILISYFASKQTKETKNGTMKTSDSYRQTLWCCFNNFFGFLYNMNYISENYMTSIKKTKNNDLERINKNRILLTKNDFKKILNTVSIEGGDLKNRDMLIMELFMTTGMRETALSNINIEDIDLINKKLYVIDKGEKLNEYDLSDKIINSIKRLIVERNSNNGALFISQKGCRLSSKGIYYLVKKYSNYALGYEISPHKLRSGFISIIYNKTKDIDFCRRAVGHSNISTTQRYIATNNNERKESMEFLSNIITM